MWLVYYAVLTINTTMVVMGTCAVQRLATLTIMSSLREGKLKYYSKARKKGGKNLNHKINVLRLGHAISVSVTNLS